MDPDYYAILGVSPTADLETIRHAFRQKAAQCHPDHGGSHERMVEVNTAWEILSDPELRFRYDTARNYAATAEARNAAAYDRQTAERRAEQYPKSWPEYQHWLDQVANDFSNAKYGRMKGYRGTVWPTASNSVSAIAFIVGGGGIALILSLVFLFPFAFKSGIMVGLRMLVIVSPFVVCAGCWVGYWLHTIVGGGIRSFATEKPRDSSAGSPRGQVVVQCPNCNQKLNLPKIAQVLAVTCPRCKYKFDLPPSVS